MCIRDSVYGVDCGIQNEQLYPACRLLSLIIGRPIAANKAIVGSNAFAHESGIHQDVYKRQLHPCGPEGFSGQEYEAWDGSRR